MNIPNNLKYSKSHEWVLVEADGTAKIGLTDYAQDSLGGLVFVNLPDVGDVVEAGEAFGDVESVKAVSDIISPVSATINEINGDLLDAPELINSDPYGSWLIQVSDITEEEELLTPEEYEAFCKEEA